MKLGRAVTGPAPFTPHHSNVATIRLAALAYSGELPREVQRRADDCRLEPRTLRDLMVQITGYDLLEANGVTLIKTRASHNGVRPTFFIEVRRRPEAEPEQ